MPTARMPGRSSIDTAMRHPYMADALAAQQAEHEDIERQDGRVFAMLACAVVAAVALAAAVVLAILGDHP